MRDIPDIMRKVRSYDTLPELIFRKALWSNGLRYRLNSKKLAGKPDIILPSERVAIFIDGDFWHGGQWKRRKLLSLEDQFGKGNKRKYWLKKIRNNMERDCRVVDTLTTEGWKVIRFWESAVYNDVEGCIKMTLELANNGKGQSTYSLLPQKTFSEFFAGIGLVRYALERQGWKVTFANDIDPLKYQMYKGQFENADDHFILEDIHKISPDSIPSFTLATASFPCNDLSLAGNRHGLTGKQSSAFWGFVDLLKGMGKRRPPLVLIENVPGFLTSKQGKDFREALLALNGLGYDVDSFMVDANNFVPQSRQRLFVIGVVSEKKEQTKIMESPLFYESAVRPKALASFIFNNPMINWNLRHLPNPPSSKRKLDDILDDIPESSSVWWVRERSSYLLNQMSKRHREIADGMIADSNWSYGTVFRRIRNGKSMGELRVDGVAGCLRTPRGGSGRQILFKAGYGKYFVRLLTPRECARLMGANDYRITAPLNQALFGFGDAVCVPVIEWIAQNYLNPLVNELIRGHVLHAPLERVAS